MVWKIILIQFFFLLLTFWDLPAQHISGKILSIDNTTLPVAHLKLSSYKDIQKFSDTTIKTDKSGHFEIPLPEPGLYEIKILGVMHKSITFPLLIANQEKMEFNIFLEPEPYKSGRYFDREEYLNWIRVYGNFNQYSYENGLQFDYHPDGSISALIESERDTIRYMIRGLTNGPGVLPGDDNYVLNSDGHYEGLIVNDSGAVHLKYDPNADWPYKATYKNFSGLSVFLYRGYLSFQNESDTLWVRGPSMTDGRFSLSQFGIIRNEQEKHQEANRKYSGIGSYFEQMKKDIKNGLYELEKLIPKETDKQKRSVLLLAYTGMATRWHQNQEQYSRFLNSDGFEEVEINDKILSKVIQEVTPVHPMWSVNQQMPIKILEQTNFSKRAEVIDYFTNMARYHDDTGLSGVVIMKLLEIETSRMNVNKDAILSLYELILERYGDYNLARKAREKIEESELFIE